jgi:hypothetical protein
VKIDSLSIGIYLCFFPHTLSFFFAKNWLYPASLKMCDYRRLDHVSSKHLFHKKTDAVVSCSFVPLVEMITRVINWAGSEAEDDRNH